MKNKILVIEDDVHILELIKSNLESNEYLVDVATDGKKGLDLAIQNEPDLIILDIMLPELDGLSVLNAIRQKPEIQRTPIILLSAISSEIDKIVGLEVGADDYMTKPFSISELIARIKAHLRRSERDLKTSLKIDPIITYENLVMDLEKYEVSRAGKPLKLSLKEFELLKMLLENKGKVLSRDQLLDQIWGYNYYGETRTVDVHIRHLRSKIDEDDSESIISTVRGIGYTIK